MKAIDFLLKWGARAMLPFSFLVAALLEPWTMLREWRELPRVWRHMWDEPF